MDPASPELVALLAACRARPADDLPRLVLADWLDENGDPDRAEFVRVQVELSHPTADARRTAELRDRETRLLEAHHRKWIAGYWALWPANPNPVGAVVFPREHTRTPPRVCRCQFDRGTIQDWSSAELLDRPDWRGWLRSPEAAWLEQVNLAYTSVEQFVKADLPDELHHRIGLTLDLGELSDEVALRQQFRLLAVSSNFTAVRSLVVSKVDGGVVLDELTKADVSSLVRLEVARPTMSGERLASHIASAPFAALSSFEIGPISAAGFRALAASPHLGNLTKLNLIGCRFGDAGMVALCGSKLAHTLRAVEFPNTGIGDAGAVALARSPLFAHLHGPRLNLMMNRIGDAGLTALAESEHLLRFSELVLRENQVGDEGVMALAESPYSANLRFLDFWRNRITDRGAFALARSPHLNSVVDLSVKENAVTAAGAAALHERFGEAAKV